MKPHLTQGLLLLHNCANSCNYSAKPPPTPTPPHITKPNLTQRLRPNYLKVKDNHDDSL